MLKRTARKMQLKMVIKGPAWLCLPTDTGTASFRRLWEGSFPDGDVI